VLLLNVLQSIMARIFFNYLGALLSLVLLPAITCLCCQEAHASNHTEHKHSCCKESGTSNDHSQESNSNPLNNIPFSSSSYSILIRSGTTHCDCLLGSLNVNKHAIIAKFGVIDSECFNNSLATNSKHLSHSSKITSKELRGINEVLLFLTFSALSHKDYFQTLTKSNPQQPRSPPLNMSA